MKVTRFFSDFLKFFFFEYFQKKYIFYLINQSLNLSEAWTDILFHQKSLITIIDLFSKNMLHFSEWWKSMSVQKLWRKVGNIWYYKISWCKTKINCVNSFFMKSNLICIKCYVHSTYWRSYHILQSKIHIYIVLNFQFDMNSSRIHKIMALVQKYEILEYLSFNVFYLYCTRGNATTQNLHYTQIFYIGWPYGTCFKPIVLTHHFLREKLLIILLWNWGHIQNFKV